MTAQTPGKAPGIDKTPLRLYNCYKIVTKGLSMFSGKYFTNAICALLGAVFLSAVFSGTVKASAASPALGSLDLESLAEADRDDALENLGFESSEEA